MSRQSIIVWVIIAIGIVFLFNAAEQNKQKDVEVSFSNFIQYDLKNVHEIYVNNETRGIRYLVTGNSSVKHTTYPTEQSLDKVVNQLLEKGVMISATPPPTSSFLATFLISMFPVLLLVGVLVWIYKKNSSGGSAVSAFSRSPASLVDPSKNNVKLDDVAGNPGDFDDVHEIIDFLKDPQKYHNADAKLPRGILMYGPPGVGKTLLARAIAGEAGVPFYTISGSAFVEMFVGVGASRVRNMFAQLRAHQPAILFIDEIDTVGASRGPIGYGGGHQEAGQTLNQLLTEMDGFTNEDTVMVIAATNRPDTLDPALLRPGRFDRKIAIGLPDINARQKILEVHTKGRKLDDDVDLRIIAKGTPGMSGADLANLVNEAAMIIGKAKRVIITMKDFEAARDKVFMGREKSLAMDKDEKEMTAYHEAGHAIAAYESPGHDPVYKITIIPRDRALGVTMYLPEDDKYSIKHKQLRAQLVSLMGGRAAEEVKYGEDNISTGASNDLERATELARNMITKWGFSETGLISFRDRDYDLLSDDTKEKIDNQVRDLLSKSYTRAKEILQEKKEKLEAVAAALVERETIDFAEFKEIMENG